MFSPIDPEELKGRLLEQLNEKLLVSEAQLRAELTNKVRGGGVRGGAVEKDGERVW